MKIDFILPDIGEGIVECELVDWHISEGMAVTEDQSVADVMTDKALVEITSMYTGTISKLYFKMFRILFKRGIFNFISQSLNRRTNFICY